MNKNATWTFESNCTLGQFNARRGMGKGGMAFKQKSELIAVLLDSTAREDERDDAAMDLSDFEGDDVVKALFSVGNDESFESEMVKGSCGESLASIWLRTGGIDFGVLSRLEGTARTEAIGLIKINHEDWYSAFVNQRPK